MRTRIWLILLIVVIAGLVAFRLYLPTLILNRTNATLAKLRGYDGHIDSVEIRWPSGAHQSFQDLEADQFYLIQEGNGTLAFQKFTPPRRGSNVAGETARNRLRGAVVE